MANTTWTPLHNQGPFAVPPGITNGVTFMRQRDNSLDPAAPLPIQDYLDVIMYENISFVHGNATGRSYSIPLTNFDSSGPSFCIPVPGVNTTLYARPSDEPPKRLTMKRLIRRPRPDFTTA